METMSRRRVSERVLVALIRQKMLTGRKQERTKLALARIHRLEEVSLQKSGEVLLGQVLRFIWFIALPADKGVEGIPITSAKRGQRLTRLRRVAILRSRNDAPMRRREPPGGKKHRMTIGIGHGAIVMRRHANRCNSRATTMPTSTGPWA